MDWDKYFMSMVALVAMKSKDENTNHGAVIVGPDNEVRSTGYNNFVRGLDDDVPERQESPEKYFWFEHAERNAVYNAARHGVSLKGCTMYVSGIPCADCARAVIQSGITEVVYLKLRDDNTTDKWREHAERSITMFEETGVKLRGYDDGIVKNLYFYFNGKRVI